MVAWNASRNGIHLPTLSNRFLLDIEMGEMVILVSKTSESQLIRDSSFATGYLSVTKVMIGSMVVMKNTYKSAEMVCDWNIIELQLNKAGHAKFQMVKHLKNNKITNKIPLYTFPNFRGMRNCFAETLFPPRNAPSGATSP
jgi:hypothetical protein